MSSKQYMDELVVPTMLRALSAVNKERPADPIDFLIAYLSKEREKGGDEEAEGAPMDTSGAPVAGEGNSHLNCLLFDRSYLSTGCWINLAKISVVIMS